MKTSSAFDHFDGVALDRWPPRSSPWLSSGREDSWSRVMMRWACLVSISLFVVLVSAALAGMFLNFYTATERRLMALGIAGTIALWVIGRAWVVIATTRMRRFQPRRGLVRGVSVVIPCCNAAEGIDETVRSILASSVPELEILLVENNSTDDTWRVLEALDRDHPEVRALRVDVRPDEYAASVAINHGVSAASHDAIIRMDDDTVMSPTMIEEATSVLMAPDTAAVAVNLRVSNPRESIYTRLQAMEYMLAMELDRRFQVLIGSVLCCSGGLAAFRRRTIVDSGGFCSAPKWVSEDLDMTMKAHRLGRVAVAHRAVGYTEVPATLKALVKQRYRWGISGVVAFYLHKRGVGRRSYWYDGRIGFFGLPIFAVVRTRDMLAVAYVALIAETLATGRLQWLAVLLLLRMALMALQLLTMTLLLHERQGVYYYWLIPFFVLVYGPILLAARFAGSWAGMNHIRALKRRQAHLEHAGLDPNLILSRGLTSDTDSTDTARSETTVPKASVPAALPVPNLQARRHSVCKPSTRRNARSPRVEAWAKVCDPSFWRNPAEWDRPGLGQRAAVAFA